MATNILSLVTQFLTPELIGRIASILGLDRSTAQDAIGASVPAILASLAGIASEPGGARQLSSAMAQQRPGALDSVIDAIGGPGQRALADSGSNMLSSLLGGSAMNMLTGAIAKASGIGEGVSKSLLGTLAPIVFGALGQQQRAAGLDANGLASLLASQKDQIASALPSGIAQQLSAAGLLDQVGSGIRSGAAAAAGAAGRLGDASQQWASRAGEAASAARSAASTPQWPYWVLALAALAGLGWLVFGPWGREQVAEAPRTEAVQPKTVGVGVPSITVGGVDLAKQVTESVDGLRTALTGITDPASAQAALPKIRDAKAQLDTISALSDRLPAEGKRSLARLVAAAMPSINALIDKAMAIPGVGEVASPAINDLRVRLNSLATA
jgi:hypothetical protein